MNTFLILGLAVILPLAGTLAFVLVRGSLHAKNPAEYALKVLEGIPDVIRVLRDVLRAGQGQ
ncbi:hypothetical protein OHB00_12990 [Streptomyces sp. NBC_00631]|uniref:hypothetical protein n=1 Tax=Streptomyces sp. NBC_00631 TaxID=2975793 RepID=UPI0030E0CD9D